MVALSPITAHLVRAAHATSVVSWAYDALRPDDRRRIADENPDSFFNVVRSTVDFNLDQLSGGTTSDAERDVLASFCLGSWDPAMDANAERNGIASFVVPWYLAGRA